MARWFRFYDDAVNDPKVQRLPAPLFKLWVNVLCLASKNNGALPPIADMAFVLRLPEKKITEFLNELVGAGLIDRHEDSLSPHNWHGRQFESDSAAERMRRHRQRMRDVTVTSQVTPPAANSDVPEQNQIQNRTEQNRVDAPRAAPVADRGTRFDLETLPEDWRAECVARRPDLKPEWAFERFKNYWQAKPGKDGRKVDWRKTWLNWISTERAPPGQPPPLFAQPESEAMKRWKAESDARHRSSD